MDMVSTIHIYIHTWIVYQGPIPSEGFVAECARLEGDDVWLYKEGLGFSRVYGLGRV